MSPATATSVTPVTSMTPVVTMVTPLVSPGGLAVSPTVTAGHLPPRARAPVTVRAPTGPDLSGGELSLPLRPYRTLPPPAAP